ncbi:MAG: hypothetical protein HY862_16450 [Chloroflexi bacterium]|nr:hypothetical protein [Chloroflexota bacterium]
MGWIDEYNQRQYRQMLFSIELCESEHASAGEVFNSLIFLSNCLEGVDQQWKEQLIQIAGILEEVYSYTRIENRKMSDSEKSLVKESLHNLRAYIQPMLTNDDLEID